MTLVINLTDTIGKRDSIRLNMLSIPFYKSFLINNSCRYRLTTGIVYNKGLAQSDVWV